MDEVWIESGEVSMDKSGFRAFPDYMQTVLKIGKKSGHSMDIVWQKNSLDSFLSPDLIHTHSLSCK